MKLYLSPSNQPSNRYYGKNGYMNTNEKLEMEAVASKVKKILDRDYLCETVIATLTLGIKAAERPQEAKNKGCDFYLAIHSNAADNSPPNKATGAVGIYHPKSAESKKLMTAMVSSLDSICPIKSDRSQKLLDGMTAFAGQGYGEIRSPWNKGIPSALVEVNFHDNPVTSEWIVNNKDAIAESIVKTLVSTFAIAIKTTDGLGGYKPSPPPQVNDRVRFKTNIWNYFPNGPTFSADVKTGVHVVTKDSSNGKQVIYGGVPCVLLGKRVDPATGKEIAGVNTWTAVDYLEPEPKVAAMEAKETPITGDTAQDNVA